MKKRHLLMLVAMLSGTSVAAQTPMPVRLGSPHMQHRGSVWTVAIAPDSKTAASSSYGGPVYFWDITTGSIVRELPGDAWNITFAPDGKSFYARTGQGPIRQLDSTTHREIRCIPSLGYRSLAVSPDGRWLAAGASEDAVLWDSKEARVVRVLPLPGDNRSAPAGVSFKKGVFVAELATGKTVCRFAMPDGYAPKKTERAPPWLVAVDFVDNYTIACLSVHGQLFLVDVRTGKHNRVLTFGEWANHVAASRDGKKIAVGGDLGDAIYLHDLATGKRQSLKSASGDTSIHHLLFTPDSKHLVAVGMRGWIAVWEAATGKPPPALQAKSLPIDNAALSPDGSRALAWPERGAPRWWDTRDGKDLGPFSDDLKQVNEVLFAADGKTLVTAAGYPDYAIRAWDIATRKERAHLGEHGRPRAISRDGKRIAAEAREGIVQVIDAASGNVHEFKTGIYDLQAAFSLDATLLAAASNKAVIVWDLTTGKERQRYRVSHHWSRALAFTPDGKELRFAGDPYYVRRWDMVSGKELEALPLGPGVHGPFLLSSDGAFLVHGEDDAFANPENQIVLRDLKTGQHWVRAVEPGSLKLSGDGKALAVTRVNGAVSVWQTPDLIARGQPPKVRAKPQPKPDPPDHTTATRIGPAPSPLVGGIGSIAISRDGKAFVIGANTRGEGVPLCLYDVATRKQIRRFGTDTYERGMVCLSPDGKTLAHWSHYHLEFWDIDTGVQNWRLPGPHGDPTALAFSPDGKLLATAYMAGQSDFAPIQLWDVARGRELEPLVGHKRTVHALAFTPDGRLVSFGDAFADSGRKAESTVAVWNVQTSKLLKRVDHFFAGAGCCLSPYGSLLLTQDDGKLQISSSLNEKVRRTLPAVNFHSHAVFSPDGKQLATSGDRDPINLWDPATGKKTRSFADGLSARDVLGFSADGKILASAGVAGFSLGPNRVRIWEVDTGNEVHVPPGHTGRVTAAVHSPDAKLLASADADGVIHLWELPGGQQRAALPGLKASSIEALAFTLDGRTLVAASNERVASWDLAKADSPSVWTLDKKKNEHLTLSRDGKTLVTVDDAGNVACWNIPSGKPFLKLQIPTRVRSMALSPAGDVLAIGTDAGSDDLVQLWSLPTGRPLPSVSPGKRDADYVHLTFSPDGRFLATSDIFPHSSAARLRLWEVTSGQPICTVTGMDLIPMVFAFTPDSSALLYTCWKQREWLGQRGAILRDLSTFKDLKQITGGEFEGVCLTSGRALKPLHGHTGAISVVSFAPDGKSVVTGGTDGSLLSWPTAPHRQTLPREPGPVDAAKLWSDLSKEAGAAYRAIARLQADPAEAVRVARRELRPAAFPDAAEVDRWIGELNHPNFVVRGRANESLEKLGEVIEPALRKAAEKPASVEQGRRLQALLDKAGQAHRRPENLAALRAIGLLERIATPEARALLRTLADGAPAARSTQDAKAALKRMGG